MTKSRKEISNIISSTQVPLTAKEIHESLDRQYDLATIYRGLSYFEKQGIITSFSFYCSKDGMERYYYLHKQPHVHFFHCSSCHTFIPLDTCKLQSLEHQIEQDYNLSIQEHTLYFTGLCASCR